MFTDTKPASLDLIGLIDGCVSDWHAEYVPCLSVIGA